MLEDSTSVPSTLDYHGQDTEGQEYLPQHHGHLNDYYEPSHHGSYSLQEPAYWAHQASPQLSTDHPDAYFRYDDFDHENVMLQNMHEPSSSSSYHHH